MKLSKKLIVGHVLVALAVFGLASRLPPSPLLLILSLLVALGCAWGVAQVIEREEIARWSRALLEMSGRVDEKIEEVKRERTQLAAILSALVESVVAVDHEGRVLLINPAAEKLFEVSSAAVKGRPVLEVLRQSALHEVIQQTLLQRQAVSQEISIHAPQERVLVAQALPVSYGEGRTGVLAAFHDITELRKLETVRQEFIANVSHELKTPLTAIKGYVETLLSGAMEDKTLRRDFLKVIDEHSQHLSLLIDDVLDLSAIEANRMEYHFESVSVPELVDRLMKGLAPQAKVKKVDLVNQISKDLPRVRADRAKLAQILLNLIDNAIKFNRESGKVKFSGTSKKGQVILTIKDTGLGIAPDDLPRVFERFYRADKAHSREIEGTGLGLAIVKHLLEAHQGTISVQSTLGEGSAFTVTLPAA